MSSEPGSGVSERWVKWRRAVDLDEYDRRWQNLEAQGRSVHGELDFVERRLPNRTLRILDAGCGTGRLAIEAARRGHRVTGVDLDPDMIERARSKAPDLEWICCDLATVDIGDSVDVAVMAGNIPLFCAPGSQAAIISSLGRLLVPGGLLICGFSIEKGSGAYSPDHFRHDAESSGLEMVDRYSSWDEDLEQSTADRTEADDDYAVIVCRRPNTDD